MQSTNGQTKSRGSPIAAAVLSCSVSDFRGLLGVAPEFGSLAVPTPLVQHAEWAWAHPIVAVLRFGGWTIDDVVSNRDVARSVCQLWKLWRASQRITAEREATNARALIEWWRGQGCPVSCPECGRLNECTCGA